MSIPDLVFDAPLPPTRALGQGDPPADVNAITTALTQVRTKTRAALVPTVRTPEQHGAVGDGTTDDQAALVAWLAALQAGEIGRMGLGKVYAHSNKLALPARTDVEIDGNLATLRATNSLLASLHVPTGADRAFIHHLKHEVIGASGRGSADFDMAPLVAGSGVSGLRVEDFISVGSKSAGLFIFECSDGEFRRITTRDSLADGFHFVRGCTNMLIEDYTATNIGDDGLAFVDYQSNPVSGRGFRARGIRVVRSNAGRGISAIGVSDVDVDDYEVIDTYGAGVYIGRENGGTDVSTTRDAARVRFANGKITRGNTLAGGPDAGSVLILAAGGAITDIDVTGVQIHDPNPDRGIINVKGTGVATRVRVRRSAITGTYNTSFPVNVDAGVAAGTTVEAPIYGFRTLANGAPAIGGGTPAYVGAKGLLTPAFSHASGAVPLLAFTTEDFDSSGYHDNTTNPSRFTVPADRAGKYLLTANVAWATNGTALRAVFFRKNGLEPNIHDELRQAVTGDKTRIATTGMAVLAAGDYVECGIYQNSGATLAVDAGSYFSLTYLGA